MHVLIGLHLIKIQIKIQIQIQMQMQMQMQKQKQVQKQIHIQKHVYIYTQVAKADAEALAQGFISCSFASPSLPRSPSPTWPAWRPATLSGRAQAVAMAT